MKASTLILGAVAAAGIVLTLVQTSARQRLSGELTQARLEATDLNDRLAASQSREQTLEQQRAAADRETEALQARVTASEARVSALTREAAELQLQLAANAESTASLRQEAGDLRQELARHKLNASPLTLAEVKALESTIVELEDKLASLEAADPAPPTEAGPGQPVPGSRYPVVSVGPGDAFVILAYTAGQGARPAQQLQVARGTEAVATVQITEVRDRFAIAHVRPESLRSGLRKGDSASIPTAP